MSTSDSSGCTSPNLSSKENANLLEEDSETIEENPVSCSPENAKLNHHERKSKDEIFFIPINKTSTSGGRENHRSYKDILKSKNDATLLSCRRISKSLTDKNSSSRASCMFRRRRKRSEKFALIGYGTNPVGENKDLSPLTDETEDEVHYNTESITSSDFESFDYDRLNLNNSNAQEEMIKLPIENTEEQFNDWEADLEKIKNKGARLFAKRQMEVEKYLMSQQQENFCQEFNKSTQTSNSLDNLHSNTITNPVEHDDAIIAVDPTMSFSEIHGKSQEHLKTQSKEHNNMVMINETSNDTSKSDKHKFVFRRVKPPVPKADFKQIQIQPDGFYLLDKTDRNTTSSTFMKSTSLSTKPWSSVKFEPHSTNISKTKEREYEARRNVSKEKFDPNAKSFGNKKEAVDKRDYSTLSNQYKCDCNQFQKQRTNENESIENCNQRDLSCQQSPSFSNKSKFSEFIPSQHFNRPIRIASNESSGTDVGEKKFSSSDTNRMTACMKILIRNPNEPSRKSVFNNNMKNGYFDPSTPTKTSSTSYVKNEKQLHISKSSVKQDRHQKNRPNSGFDWELVGGLKGKGAKIFDKEKKRMGQLTMEGRIKTDEKDGIADINKLTSKNASEEFEIEERIANSSTPIQPPRVAPKPKFFKLNQQHIKGSGLFQSKYNNNFGINETNDDNLQTNTISTHNNSLSDISNNLKQDNPCKDLKSVNQQSIFKQSAFTLRKVDKSEEGLAPNFLSSDDLSLENNQSNSDERCSKARSFCPRPNFLAKGRFFKWQPPEYSKNN